MKSRQLLQNLAMPIALLGICVFFAFKLDRAALFGDGRFIFLGPRNLTQLIVEFSIAGTLALGMFLILLTGQIDLSVGSGVGLIGGIAAVLVSQQGWSAPLGMAAAFVVAMVLWTLMGTLIVRERIPSFIITLGGLLIFKGLFWRVIQSSTVPVSPGGEENAYSLLTTYYLPPDRGLMLAFGVLFALGVIAWRSRAAHLALGLPTRPIRSEAGVWAATVIGTLSLVILCNHFRGLPLSLLILAGTAGAAYFLTRHTPFGRYLYAIGGNEEASVLSGIPVNRVMIGAYLLMGVTVALTGFMTTAYAGSSTTTTGDLMELDAIAACVIGGTALRGGRGTVWGVIFGTLIMTTLLNGMTLLAVEPETKYIARGVVLTLAVWMDVRLTRAAR